ncbi:hypothetical protein DEJ43_12460 [Streptomyces venezuelae ATCC 10712]|nr:hypothetical protein DEJ43_12460 [Streptomyces venezuelae ATCC 10712]
MYSRHSCPQVEQLPPAAPPPSPGRPLQDEVYPAPESAAGWWPDHPPPCRRSSQRSPRTPHGPPSGPRRIPRGGSDRLADRALTRRREWPDHRRARLHGPDPG